MKLYSEDRMKAIRKEFELEILQHPYVKVKKMFGCPSYSVREKLFAFLVTEGIVLTELSKSELANALTIPGAQAFEHNERVVRKWVRVPIKDKKALQTIIPLVMKSYENTSTRDV